MALLKNTTSNKPSVSLTMMVVAFAVIMLWMILSIVENLGPVHIRAFSGAESIAVLLPLCSLYYVRRQTEAKSEIDQATLAASISDKPTT